MSLADRLEAPPPSVRQVRCSLCLAMRRMDPADAEAVQQAVQADSGWSDPALSAMLEGEGFDVPESALGNHRQKRHSL